MKSKRVLPLIFIEFDKFQRVLPLNLNYLVFRPFDLSTGGGKKVDTPYTFEYLLKSKGTTLDFVKFDKNQSVLPWIL